MNISNDELMVLIDHIRYELQYIIGFLPQIERDIPISSTFIKYDKEDGIYETEGYPLWVDIEYPYDTQICLPERISLDISSASVYTQMNINKNYLIIDDKKYNFDFNKDSSLNDLEQKLFELSLINTYGYPRELLVEVIVKYLYFKEIEPYYTSTLTNQCIVISNYRDMDAWYEIPSGQE